MKQQSITATKLKATLLGVLDDVADSGTPVVVTKYGHPVAKIVPIERDTSLIGSVKQLVDDDALLAPIDVAWHAATE